MTALFARKANDRDAAIDRLCLVQSLRDVGDQIGRVFDADRNRLFRNDDERAKSMTRHVGSPEQYQSDNA
jgi:hypothetical protein